jgi:hypothetical protein
MADQVKHTDTSLLQISEVGWQLVGELRLPVGSKNDDTIHNWMTEILGPLQLQRTVIDKVLQSAKETAARVVHFETATKFAHVHFLVFAPVNSASKGQTWGFFRIEKVEFAKSFKDLPDHAVEFYLYLEGQ